MNHAERAPGAPTLRETAAAAASLLRALMTPRTRRDGAVLNNGRNDGPPDLDELWRDFNRKLSGFFGGRGSPEPQGGGGGSGPDMRSAGVGMGLIGGVVALAWLGSGFFTVQEGEQAVITTFGKYSKTVEAGFQWRLPYPFQAHETVPFTQLRSVEVGRSSTVQGTGLRDSSMLTQDENIVDIRFTVQYLLKDARDYLFENREPDDAVRQAAESAVREIVGKSNMDSVLYEQRDAIAAELGKSVQAQLDRLKAGIVVKNVNVGSVQAPEQVQAAFDDAFKAGQNKEQLKNEGEAYANNVIPEAQGKAARLRQEAEGYRSRVIARAEGDAQRFKSVLAEYQKAPAVTRDRIYIDTMQQIYGDVTKVMVDSRNGSNLLYLPLDKLIQQSGSNVTSSSPVPVAVEPAPAAVAPVDRSRDALRNREGR